MSRELKRELKNQRFDLRVPTQVKQQIEHAAELQGRSVSDFVVAAALAQATSVIEQQKILQFCLNDSLALAEALTREPVVTKKAVDAARRYKQRIKQS